MPPAVPPKAAQGQEDPMIIAPAPRTRDYPYDDEFGHMMKNAPTIVMPGPDVKNVGYTEGQTGFLDGVKAFFDEKLAPEVSKGAARPLAPGEYIQLNPGKDDAWASEMTTTIQRQDGQWINIPTLWVKDGKPYVATPEEALSMAETSGLNWQSYKTQKEADEASQAREENWQSMTDPRAEASKVAPLWTAAPTNPTPQGARPVPHIYLPDVNVNPDPLKAAPGLRIQPRSPAQ